jgi:mannitol/fructose-specific phosphotransferase system IIA component (Ntr-type)
MADDSTPNLRISNLLAPVNIGLHLQGTGRDQVLRELVDLIPALRARASERERLVRALIEREIMHSTGIGDGLALPHTRNTLGGLVDHPLIAMGRHPTGIPFAAIDSKPVRLFFLLLSTSVPEHLQILARTSRLLRNPTLREGLLTASRPENVMMLLRQAES